LTFLRELFFDKKKLTIHKSNYSDGLSPSFPTLIFNEVEEMFDCCDSGGTYCWDTYNVPLRNILGEILEKKYSEFN